MRHEKTIGKPCAGNRHSRFEKGGSGNRARKSTAPDPYQCRPSTCCSRARIPGSSTRCVTWPRGCPSAWWDRASWGYVTARKRRARPSENAGSRRSTTPGGPGSSPWLTIPASRWTHSAASPGSTRAGSEARAPATTIETSFCCRASRSARAGSAERASRARWWSARPTQSSSRSRRRPLDGSPALRGENGFGYDPLFFYPPFGKTFGEVARKRRTG